MNVLVVVVASLAFGSAHALAASDSAHALAASDCAKLHDAPLKSDQAVLKVRIDEARADIMARQTRLAALLGRGDVYGSVFELDFIAAGHANVVALKLGLLSTFPLECFESMDKFGIPLAHERAAQRDAIVARDEARERYVARHGMDPWRAIWGEPIRTSTPAP